MRSAVVLAALLCPALACSVGAVGLGDKDHTTAGDTDLASGDSASTDGLPNEGDGGDPSSGGPADGPDLGDSTGDPDPSDGGDAPTSGDPTPGDLDLPGPTAELLPAPPSYWYVDALPLNLSVGGTDVVAYRYRLDTDTDFGPEVPVGTPLSIGDIPPGARTLSVIGRDAEGTWQTLPTSAPFFMITLGHDDVACTLKPTGTCDVIVATGSTERYYASPQITKLGYEIYLPATGDLAPGARICLQAGAHGARGFRGYTQGTVERPLEIVNCGGQAAITKSVGSGGAALSMSENKRFRIVGNGSTTHTYGILLSGAVPGAHGVYLSGGATDFEVAYVEVDGARNHAIDAKSDSTSAEKCLYNRNTFVQRNTFVHHVYLHDVYYLGSGVGSDTAIQGYECIYAGSSHWASTFDITCQSQPVTVREHELHGVRIHDSRFEECGNEGIQLGSAPYDVAVYRNIVRNVGKHRDPQHCNGIQMGGGTTGLVEGNYVDNAGIGIWFAGPANGRIVNNVVVNTIGPSIQVSMGPAFPNTGLHVIHNTFVNPGMDIGLGDCIIRDDLGAPPAPFDMCFCGDRRAMCYYDSSSVGSVYYNNLAPGTPAVPSGSRLTVGNNVTSGTNDDHFVDDDSENFHLRSDANACASTACDTGRDVSAYGVLVDFEGRERNTSLPDVGAHEFGL